MRELMLRFVGKAGRSIEPVSVLLVGLITVLLMPTPALSQTSSVGSQLRYFSNFSSDIIFRFSRPLEIPLHWGGKIIFDAAEMVGGPTSDSRRQSLRLGNVRDGVFHSLSGAVQVNSVGNTIYVSSEGLGLAVYLVHGQVSQGIFITIRDSIGPAYAKIVSVPYSGGPADFPPTEILVRASGFAIADVEAEFEAEGVLVKKKCVGISK